MKEANFPIWDNEIDIAAVEIKRVSAQIPGVIKKLKSGDITFEDTNFNLLVNNITKTLSYWTGHTYVGQEKDKMVQKAFQSFFGYLYDFLMFCLTEDRNSQQFYHGFADRALYQGNVYRYLGHCSGSGNYSEKIEPIYNDIYVSWSKKPDNPYILSKLCGTKTLLTCEIAEPYYGIDLDAFGVVRAEEQEVVFPTIMEMIKEVKYIEYNDEE